MNEFDRVARVKCISSLERIIFSKKRTAQKLIFCLFLSDLASISLCYFICFSSIPPQNDYLQVTSLLPITVLMLGNAVFLSFHLNHPETCKALANGWMWSRCLLIFVELSGCVTVAMMMDQLGMGTIGCVLLTIYTFIAYKSESCLVARPK